jgi:hypothetical protein
MIKLLIAVAVTSMFITLLIYLSLRWSVGKLNNWLRGGKQSE